MSFLTLQHVSKRYGDFTAIEQLDLSVERGEFLSLLGPSGCGKTTTLQMIAGFVAPSAGRVTLDGRDITHERPEKRGIGVVFQSYALFPHMTVAGNVGFGLEMRKMKRAQREERIAEALALVRLDGLDARYPKELSGGQRQRVAIARAIAMRPELLLLDEPMSNLDAKLREEMHIELRAIQKRLGITTILVTHDQVEAMT
ncbi:Fe3+/spermidine/putrescine ABC transporter ATP-binding protein, partial [Burkholderia multivorans]